MKAKTSKFMLMPAPSPLDGPLRTDADVAHHRRLYCAHYDGCLDESVRRSWGGFTCMHCPLRSLAGEGPSVQPFADQRRLIT